ncbi:hypothetical protein RHMOL_Rhmol01G0170900 [Rhododendron molle]|uniref:Uncharacterized protein n=1 Tax=Rhododendron molle TaxID=49168 RepID=A0ACC0Q2X7_RHOML|nr:hypothetical protein RHMOL_Rhmol01G0170900 [Rhododendron molle]
MGGAPRKSKLGLASSSVKDWKLLGWYTVPDYPGARVVLVPDYPGAWGGTCTRLPLVWGGIVPGYPRLDIRVSIWL